MAIDTINSVLDLRMLAEDLVKRCNALWLQRGPPNDNYRDLAETCRKALTTVAFSSYGAKPLMFTQLKRGVAKYETVVPAGTVGAGENNNNGTDSENDNVSFDDDNNYLLLDESMTSLSAAPTTVIDIINAGSVSYIADTLSEIEDLITAEEIGHAADVEDHRAREKAYRDWVLAQTYQSSASAASPSIGDVAREYERFGDIDSDDDWEDPDEDRDVYSDLATTQKAKQIRHNVYEATVNGCGTVDMLNRFYKYETVPWFNDSERDEDGLPGFFIQTCDNGNCSGLRIEDDHRAAPNQWCVRLAHRNCTLYKSYSNARTLFLGNRGRIILDNGWEITWHIRGDKTAIERVSFTEKSGERWILNVPASLQSL